MLTQLKSVNFHCLTAVINYNLKFYKLATNCETATKIIQKQPSTVLPLPNLKLLVTNKRRLLPNLSFSSHSSNTLSIPQAHIANVIFRCTN